MWFTFTGGSAPAWLERFFSDSDSVSQQAAALEAPRKVGAPSSVSTHTRRPALIHICTGHTNASRTESGAGSRLKAGPGPGSSGELTLAVGPIVGDEDGHVVGGAVATQAGAVVAAVGVVAGGALTADFISLDLAFILIYETEFIKTAFKS